VLVVYSKNNQCIDLMNRLQVRFSVASEDLIKPLFAIRSQNICNCHLDEKAWRGGETASRRGVAHCGGEPPTDCYFRNKMQNPHTHSQYVCLTADSSIRYWRVPFRIPRLEVWLRLVMVFRQIFHQFKCGISGSIWRVLTAVYNSKSYWVSELVHRPEF
jgi:hypothetical protein